MVKQVRLIRSFQAALMGVRIAFREEQNFRIQVIVGSISVFAAFLLNFSPIEWALLLLTIGTVLTAEIANSVIERIIDSIKPRVSPLVQAIKDLMGAGVLVLACVSLVIGLLLFMPRFIHILYSLFSGYLVY